MSNINFLGQILSSDKEYWVVAKQTRYMEYFEYKKGDDDILLISLPRDVEKITYAEDIDSITIKQLRSLEDKLVDTNIFLSGDTAPFQYGQDLGSFYRGFPVEGDGVTVKEFLVKALQLGSHDINAYKELMDRFNNPAKNPQPRDKNGRFTNKDTAS